MLNLDYMLDQLIIGSLLKRAFVLVPLHILPSPVLYYVQARIDLGSKQRAWLSPSITAAAAAATAAATAAAATTAA